MLQSALNNNGAELVTFQLPAMYLDAEQALSNHYNNLKQSHLN